MQESHCRTGSARRHVFLFGYSPHCNNYPGGGRRDGRIRRIGGGRYITCPELHLRITRDLHPNYLFLYLLPPLHCA
jgi:hypothetical protein